MSFGQTHSAFIATAVNEVVAAAEEAFSLLREPLAAELTKHRAALEQHVRSSAKSTLAIFGKSITEAHAEQLEPIEAECLARRLADLDSLTRGLQQRDVACVRRFADVLLADMARALEVHDRVSESADPAEKHKAAEVYEALGIPEDDVRTIVLGDTSFRMLHYFVQFSKRVIEKAGPVSMLSLRSR